ncbi:MAG TPA: hypothetical protein VJ961_08465, partial [Mariprofundaceae bacterium]|nr:hypothetical protein [Mariprofundaceae bacterium]
MIEYVEMHTCPLCGSEAYEVLYNLDVPVVRCKKCTLVYLNPQPRVDHQGFYDESYYRGSSTKKADQDNEDVLEAHKVDIRLESC